MGRLYPLIHLDDAAVLDFFARGGCESMLAANEIGARCHRRRDGGTKLKAAFEKRFGIVFDKLLFSIGPETPHVKPFENGKDASR